ncbi:SprB repeat-containing protein [Mucilaginibacter sp. UR6-1]|uniref:SprB repeat-containing protein n=1 Tax=Mucilaginibacter sp. UR6-1 TaxID=1435643 RepID=UPI001E42595F|nr:SprB repeat-containing protein [Mucilaginibacter sp. UR6-1]MCC8409782.1 SprB repeat-containing protein [Mucilaginibacter sp. UR6-1]
MAIIAKIDITDYSYSYPDQNGGQTTYANVYIRLTDSNTGAAVNGNNTVVFYNEIEGDGFITNSVTIPGQSILIFSGMISEYRYDYTGVLISSYSKSYAIKSVIPATEPVNPTVCDLKINYVTVNKPESAPGAADGQITVNAASSYGPITYSIDGGDTFQLSPIFANLRGGLVQITVKDGNPLGCTQQTSIQVPIQTGLLIDDPSVTVGNNTSRWNAAFNPVIFSYQRRDFDVLKIDSYYIRDEGNKARLHINGDMSLVKADDLVYINCGVYQGVFKVKTKDAGKLVLDTPYKINQTGFVNINSIRPYYKMQTRITYQDADTGQEQTIIATHRPDGTGLTRADISTFLQSLLQVKDSSNYTQVNHRDTNLSASYSIAYDEVWDGKYANGTQSKYTVVAGNYYVLYAAKQLGEKHGGNLAAYVPFKSVAGPSLRAKWIADFIEPAYSNGYPFDVGFIYSEDMLGLALFCELKLLDVNRQPLPGALQNQYLLNENGSWLLNQDGSKMVISRQTTGDVSVPAQLGLNRLLINQQFPAEAHYVTIALKYVDTNQQQQTVTQLQTIRIDKAIDDASVYLRWIGLSGSWNYYRFVYNQEVSLDVQNAVIIKNYVHDWENQQGIEEVISKSAGQKVKVMAEDLPVQDIKGLQSIKYSPKVQMLVGKNPVKWQTIVVNTATYSEYETRNGQAPFSITFNMPAINIQAQ